jgi:hypothetical protein
MQKTKWHACLMSPPFPAVTFFGFYLLLLFPVFVLMPGLATAKCQVPWFLLYYLQAS